MADSPRPIESSVRAYGVLVTAYPAPFRREYRDEMALVFREMVTDAWRERGVVGLALAWCRVLGDLARTAPREHFSEMRRRLEMKHAALAFLSAVVAGLAYSVFFYVGAVIVMSPLIAGMNNLLMAAAWIVIMVLAAFLTGLILTQIKRLVTPRATVPVGTMAMGGLWGFGVIANTTWGVLALWAALVVSLGITSYVGCLVATKARDRVARFAVPWYQLIGPLAVLICTSFTACTIRLTLLCHELEPEFRHILSWCLFALFIVSAATIASLIVLFVRTYRRAAVQ